MNELEICEGAVILPPKARQQEIPFLATWLLMGATVHKSYKGCKDVVALELDGEFREVAIQDMEIISELADRVSRKIPMTKVVSALQSLELYRLAQTEMQTLDKRSGLKGVVMLKDMAGSGYWRMVLPARYMEKDGIFIDVTAAAVKFDYLLEYDTVFIQRVHDWESFYVLEKLKTTGKRIVYDLDDDLFSITPVSYTHLTLPTIYSV